MSNDNQIITPTDTLKANPEIPTPGGDQEPQQEILVDDPMEVGKAAMKILQAMSKDNQGAIEIQGAFFKDDGREFVYKLNCVVTALQEVKRDENGEVITNG